jgi:hypothetical protein
MVVLLLQVRFCTLHAAIVGSATVTPVGELDRLWLRGRRHEICFVPVKRAHLGVME